MKLSPCKLFKGLSMIMSHQSYGFFFIFLKISDFRTVSPRLVSANQWLVLTIAIESASEVLNKKYNSVEIAMAMKDSKGDSIQPEHVWKEVIEPEELFNASTQLPPVVLPYLPIIITFDFILKFDAIAPEHSPPEVSKSSSLSSSEKTETLNKPSIKKTIPSWTLTPTPPTAISPDKKLDEPKKSSVSPVKNNVGSATWSVDNFSDLSIECKDGSILKVHQSVLFNKCPTLKTAFPQKTGVNREMKFVNMEPQAVKEAIRFIYTEELGDINGIEKDVLALSQKLQIAGLTNACVALLAAKLSNATAVETLVLSQQSNFKELKDVSMRFILSNLKEIRQLESFKDLEKHPELLIEILCHKEFSSQ